MDGLTLLQARAALMQKEAAAPLRFLKTLFTPAETVGNRASSGVYARMRPLEDIAKRRHQDAMEALNAARGKHPMGDYWKDLQTRMQGEQFGLGGGSRGGAAAYDTPGRGPITKAFNTVTDTIDADLKSHVEALNRAGKVRWDLNSEAERLATQARERAIADQRYNRYATGGAAAGLGLGAAGAATLAGGSPETAPEAPPQGPPTPEPPIVPPAQSQGPSRGLPQRQHNVQAVTSKLKSGLGRWWDRMRQQYGQPGG